MEIDHQETDETVGREESSLCKRPKQDDSVLPLEPGPASSHEGLPIVKDEIYYKDDGDSVVRVQNVLFKVHRFLLERDSSSFSNMFTMPQGDSIYEPFNDQNPLILDDSAEDFRALCWISYALPTVFKDQMSLETADIAKLVSCLIIMRKYHFESHEEWARDLLETHFLELKHPRLTDYFLNCPESRLGELLRIAHEGNTPAFLESVWTIWLQRLTQKPTESIAYALNAAERFNDRIFQGHILYKEMMRLEVFEVGSTAHLSYPTGLVLKQKLALYQGYWSLQHYWDCTVRNSLCCRFTCPSASHTCNKEWNRIWKSHSAKRLELDFNPLSSLIMMAKDLEIDCPCAKSQLIKAYDDLSNTLADHFLGPAKPPPAE